jgi:hypothetical protein
MNSGGKTCAIVVTAWPSLMYSPPFVAHTLNHLSAAHGEAVAGANVKPHSHVPFGDTVVNCT